MKSKAHIKGHPLHPILVSFPIAFLTGTFLFDLAAFIFGRGDFWYIAYYLEIAGVGFALLAAVPGIIDYIFTVPPKSTGKKRAARHGLTNTTMVLIFLGTWLYRREPGQEPYIILAAEFVGVVLLSIAGWMGGTLVYRNQIGVDPRYADAGKWKEISLGQQTGRLEVAAADELQLNQMKLVRLADKRIVLGRTEMGYCAFDDHCTHRGGSLAGGSMICGTVQCPWHGSQFDVNTGNVKAGPAKQGIGTYKVEEAGGRVYLIID
ncbi:MAG TPA: DUF2231 domain-containing protein [Chitinophagaceae bacterium]|nr:DUF2231 domain-containing protein [Chitinophagaceae bacterium]